MEEDSEEESTEEPSLDLMTKEAIHRLKRNPKGFFLMVEGALIDYAHHKNWPIALLKFFLQHVKYLFKFIDIFVQKSPG